MAAQVQAGANPSIAWALLIADTLALASDAGGARRRPADELLNLAVTWASAAPRRHR